jgi:hypothetical protein
MWCLVIDPYIHMPDAGHRAAAARMAVSGDTDSPESIIGEVDKSPNYNVCCPTELRRTCRFSIKLFVATSHRLERAVPEARCDLVDGPEQCITNTERWRTPNG